MGPANDADVFQVRGQVSRFVLRALRQRTSKGSGYPYKSLPRSQIRLLKIDTVGKDVVCSLERFSLKKLPQYDALSYAWGDELPNASILCNGQKLPVTPHLLAGLRSIHQAAMPTRLWVDAICISQSDDQEKAVQVSEMATIFRSAERVLIWLGSAENHSDDFFDNVETFNGSISVFFERRLIDDGFYRPFFIALTHVLQRDWFGRLWVVQEIILGRSLFFICGSRIVEYEKLVRLGTIMRTARLDTEFPHNDAMRVLVSIENLESARRNWEKSGELGLVNIINYACSRQVKEPLDRCYGLLSLCSPAVRRRMVVDYSPGNRDRFWRVYLRFITLYLEFCPALTALEDVLFCVDATAATSPVSELPTWCPDLGKKGIYGRLVIEGYKAGRFGLNAQEVRLRTRIEGNRIMLPGMLVDEIMYTVDLNPAFSADPSGRPFTKLLRLEEECMRLSLQRHSLVTHVRTLVADTVSRRRRDWLVPTFARSLTPYPGDIIEDYFEGKRMLEQSKSSRGLSISDTRSDHCASGMRYLDSLDTWRGRNFITTKSGRIGLASNRTKKGDLICILYSTRPVFVLRRDPGEKTHVFLGNAYVHGLMHGEARLLPDAAERDTTFLIR